MCHQESSGMEVGCPKTRGITPKEKIERKAPFTKGFPSSHLLRINYIRGLYIFLLRLHIYFKIRLIEEIYPLSMLSRREQ